MPTNFYMWFVAGLIPLVVGALYYNEKTLGATWMKLNGFTAESMKGANMAVIFGATYVFSVFLAMSLTGATIHQGGAFQMMMPDVMESGSAAQKQFNDLMSQYGGNFRTFGHGALHGVLAALMFAMPIIAINALFERRGWKYIFIHTGYWLICLTLMGGLLCATLQYAPL